MDTVYAMYFSFLQSLKLSRRISHMAMRIFITIYQTDARFSFANIVCIYVFCSTYWMEKKYLHCGPNKIQFCKYSRMQKIVLEHTMMGNVQHVLVVWMLLTVYFREYTVFELCVLCVTKCVFLSSPIFFKHFSASLNND